VRPDPNPNGAAAQEGQGSVAGSGQVVRDEADPRHSGHDTLACEMAILNERVKEQLRERFAQRLSGPVQLKLYTRPGTGRLILPSGLGCATCDDARELAEDLQASAPGLIHLEVVDVSQQESEVTELPTLALGFPGEEPRIRWQGLPAGYEFATVVDAMERVSTGEHGLSEHAVEKLAAVNEPVEVLVFATPT
jgi:alkyl hydroperoxide reductase subunit AhpF